MKTESEALRRRVSALGPRGRGARLPSELRQEIMGYAREQRRRGEGMREIGRSVGVSTESIRRWTTGTPPRSVARAHPRMRALVPIVVRDDEDIACGVTVTAPGGYRVEGLTVTTAADLLRRLA